MKKVLIFFAIIFIITAVLSFIVTFSKKVSIGEKVALVNVSGVIIDSSGVVEELKKHAKDDSIKAVVIRVDSPGGAVAPAQEIYTEVLKVKEKKKVVVSMGSVAASGGYYIAAPADRIVANAGTLTGSIGVIMEIPNFQGLMQKIGIEAQVIKSGKHKDLASVFKSLKPEDKEILQSVLDDVHDQFIRAVSDGRGMDLEEARKISDGRIFTGRMAKEAGLIDELGSLEDAIALAGKISGIKGEPEVVRKEEKFSLIEMLRSQIPDRLMGETFSGVSLKYLFTL